MFAFLGFLFYALVTPRIGRNPHARVTAAEVDIKDGIQPALYAYNVDNGYYPKSLQNLVQRTDDGTNWRGPYFDPPRIPIDPWGNQYIYEYPGKHNTNFYDLISAGPDGKVGTEDDIVNWAE